MRRSCKACLHERRAEIDQAIREGIAYRIIAEGFDLGLATISRHKDHMEQPGTAAEQDGTRRNAPEADVTESYTEQRVAAAEQPAEQSGTERDKAEQPAGHDNTGQAVLTGVIETLRGEIAAQRETLNRLLQDHAKERERADLIIMQLRQDVKQLNDKIMLLTEGKKEQAEPPDLTTEQAKTEQAEIPGKAAESPEGTTKQAAIMEQYRFTVGDRVYLMKEDIKRILQKKIF